MQRRRLAVATVLILGALSLAAPGLAQQRPPGCVDPTLEPGRIKVEKLEFTDTRTGLVWFRCPAMHVSDEGSCDPGMVMPSETWASAVEVPSWAVKRRSPWRLASVEELDSIAAKGCGYLINPALVQLMFESVWTRSAASGDKVWRYGKDKQRIESPKLAEEGGSLFAQTLYVRKAP